MPTYEYKCKSCGHEFEAFQSIKAGALRKCPKCARRRLERLISAGAGVLFKGSGFYQTDYANKSSSSASERAKENGQSGSGDKAGPKPEPKSEGTSDPSSSGKSSEDTSQ